MTASTILSTMGVLIFIITLIWGVAWLVVKLELIPGIKKKSKQKNSDNLYIVESLALDTKRRLVKVEDGEFEHLILLGPASETHINSKKIIANITPSHTSMAETKSSLNEPETSLEHGKLKDKALH